MAINDDLWRSYCTCVQFRPHVQAVLTTKPRSTTRLGNMLRNQSKAGVGMRVRLMAKAKRATHAMQSHASDQRHRKLRLQAEAAARAARAAEAEQKERKRRIRAAAVRVPSHRSAAQARA